MSFYDGLSFFIVLVIGLIPAAVLGLKEKTLKYYTLFLSILFIFMILKEQPLELLYLLVYLFIEWHVIAVYQWTIRKFGKNVAIYRCFLIFALMPLIIAKLSGFIGHHWFSFVGISYVTFRVLQVIIESYDGLIEKKEFLSTINFLIFFPSLSSGPIDRSRRFEEDIQNVKTKDEYCDLLANGLWKILIGVLYKFVLSDIAFTILGRFEGRFAPPYLIGYAYVYGIYMFFDFAGYSLMAIGTGHVLGISMPDNFNKPFISRDIKEFWDRWHISLSHWFRDFVFSRFVRNAIRGKWFKNRLSAASAGFIVNMLIMGIWHGLTKDYILYGIYHGVLLAGTEIYQKKSKFYKKHKQKYWYQIMSWGITINFVMFGFLIFSGKFFETLAVLVTMI